VSGPLQNSVFSGYLSAKYGTHVHTLVQVEEVFVAIGACMYTYNKSFKVFKLPTGI